MKRGKAFDKVAKSIYDYLKLNGWNMLVIGSPQIKKEIGALEYNYILEFGFTGAKLKQRIKNNRERRKR